MKFEKGFLVGAATAAHQVEGNNIHSDFWACEHLKHTTYAEPSLDAVDHYNRYPEDIRLMEEAGLNAYRFSIEWARIEPEEGRFDPNEIEHYRRMLICCREHHITPIVTENGIATDDDTRRICYITRAISGVQACIRDGLPVKGYLYWSLMDNFEWQKGYSMTFGLIGVDRATQTRHPKPSLAHLGRYAPER